MKTCRVCKEEKALTEFFKSKTHRGGYRTDCKRCSNAKNVSYRKANREAIRSTKLKCMYGITLADYYRILDEQGGSCACCHTDTPGGRGSFHVDHCHATGKVRGLLCAHCNTGIGKLGDTVAGVQRALDYLKKAEADT